MLEMIPGLLTCIKTAKGIVALFDRIGPVQNVVDGGHTCFRIGAEATAAGKTSHSTFYIDRVNGMLRKFEASGDGKLQITFAPSPNSPVSKSDFRRDG